MEFACVSVNGWIVDPYKQCFFYYSIEVLVLPPYYTEFINGDTVTSSVKMVKYWGGCFLIFLEPLQKLLMTLQCIPHHDPPCHICIYR